MLKQESKLPKNPTKEQLDRYSNEHNPSNKAYIIKNNKLQNQTNKENNNSNKNVVSVLVQEDYPCL